MTFSHDDIRERLVDYLYGELDDETRAAFQAHLTACAVCGAAVTGAERARTVARQVVRRPLGDAVPERARARALEAARAAVGSGAGAAPGQPKMADAVASPAPVPVDDGWFKRLRRRWTWTFPTFATVAAMAVFLLVRATIFREAKHPVSEETARELAKPAAAPEPAIPAEPSQAPSNALDGKSKAPTGRQAGEGEADTRTGPVGLLGRGTGSPLPPSPPASGGHLHRRSAGGGVSSVGAPSGGAGSAQKDRAAPVRKGGAREQAISDDSASDDLDTGAEAEQGRTRARSQDAAKDKSFDEQSRPGSGVSAMDGAFVGEAPKDLKKAIPERGALAGKRDYATPPSPAPASVAASAPAAKSSAPPSMDREESPAPAAPPSEAPHGKKSKKNQDEQPIAPAASPAERPVERAAPAADPAQALASRADGLMHARRWNDAVTAYRELLRRYPAHPAASVWRQRLATAQAALAADTGQFATPPPPQR